MSNRFLLINPDVAGYGSSMVRSFKNQNIDAALLAISLSGGVRFLKDRIAPKLGIVHFKNDYTEKNQRRIIEQVQQQDIDVILFIFANVVVTNQTLQWIKRAKPSIQIVLWLYDNIERRPKCNELLPYFDRIFTFQKSDIPAIKKLTSAPVTSLNLFCDENYYMPTDLNMKDDIDVCFVGSWNGPHYIKRRKMLRKAARIAREYGLKMVIIGNGGWRNPIRHWRDLLWARGFRQFIRPGPLTHTQINALYQRSKVVINNSVDSQLDGYPMRTFEVPASGNCLLSDHMDGIDKLFSIPNEIVTFSSLDDFQSKCLDLLNNKQKRKAIAKAGRARVIDEHTLSKRLDKIVELVRRR